MTYRSDMNPYPDMLTFTEKCYLVGTIVGTAFAAGLASGIGFALAWWVIT